MNIFYFDPQLSLHRLNAYVPLKRDCRKALKWQCSFHNYKPGDLKAPQAGSHKHFSKSVMWVAKTVSPIQSICPSKRKNEHCPSKKWLVCLEVLLLRTDNQSITSHLYSCHTNLFGESCCVLEAQTWHLVRAQERREGTAACIVVPGWRS